jgi:hypothetical protein
MTTPRVWKLGHRNIFINEQSMSADKSRRRRLPTREMFYYVAQ